QVRHRRAGRRRRGTLHFEDAVLGGQALEGEGALLRALRGRRERPQLQVGGGVPGPPGGLQPVEQLAGRRGGSGGGRSRTGEQANGGERRSDRGPAAVHARATVAVAAGGLRGRRTANTL